MLKTIYCIYSCCFYRGFTLTELALSDTLRRRANLAVAITYRVHLSKHWLYMFVHLCMYVLITNVNGGESVGRRASFGWRVSLQAASLYIAFLGKRNL